MINNVLSRFSTSARSTEYKHHHRIREYECTSTAFFCFTDILRSHVKKSCTQFVEETVVYKKGNRHFSCTIDRSRGVSNADLL